MKNDFFKPIKSLSVDEVLKISNSKISNLRNVDSLNDVFISNVSTLKDSSSVDISFYNNVKYKDDLKNTKAGFCFVKEEHADIVPENTIPIIVDNPYLAFTLILREMYLCDEKNDFFLNNVNKNNFISRHSVVDSSVNFEGKHYVGNFSVIEENVEIGDSVYIGNNVVVKKNAKIKNGAIIGDNSTIGDNVVVGENSEIKNLVAIEYALIGKNCLIHSGVKIGQDGFGFVPGKSGHLKIPQIGSVGIGDDVEIGANSTIDRGALGDTKIGDGTKIDNLVHIAHNVTIGKSCFIAANVGIAGSAVLGDFVFVGGGAGIAPHINIASGIQIGPSSGVPHSLTEKGDYIGTPVRKFYDFWKMNAILNKLVKGDLVISKK